MVNTEFIAISAVCPSTIAKPFVVNWSPSNNNSAALSVSLVAGSGNKSNGKFEVPCEVSFCSAVTPRCKNSAATSLFLDPSSPPWPTEQCKNFTKPAPVCEDHLSRGTIMMISTLSE